MKRIYEAPCITVLVPETQDILTASLAVSSNTAGNDDRSTLSDLFG